MAERRLISTGSPFETVAGYSRAVVDGDYVFVAGTTGYDYVHMRMPEAIEDQVHNCFRTISDTLAQTGSSLEDVVRANYIVTRAEYTETVLPIFGQYFGAIRPASTLIVAGLLRPEMKVEIEVTARVRG